ncbi:MAG: ATP phosphoribosyltransferase [Firmicutes bacterium]|nr:ATP phosphoribosyltransferase [Bacillota bacterium]
MARTELTIALPKGKLFEPTVELLRHAGLPWEELQAESRQLVFDYPAQEVKYIICRPTDIPTYVEYGAADLGVVGKDTIVEQNKDVYELVDLKFGACRFVVAVPAAVAKEKDLARLSHARVATKFPRVAASFFREKGIQVEVIELHGNIELAPSVGLSEAIVDIVSTGRTLKENNLVPLEDILHATARLIANRVSYRLKYQRLYPLVEKFKQIIENKGSDSNAYLK